MSRIYYEIVKNSHIKREEFYYKFIEYENHRKKEKSYNECTYYKSMLNTTELILMIIKNKNDEEFNYIYENNISNFKLSRFYNIGLLTDNNIFNSFTSLNDFISKSCKLYICNEEFYKELNNLLEKIINQEKKQEEVNEEIKIINSSKRKKKPIYAAMKRLVWHNNIGEEIGKTKCLCCKITDITQLSFNCGHIIAEANGGDTIVSNLRPICQNCNSSMGTMNMNDFMKTFK